MFSCEFCGTFKNTFIYRTPPVAAPIELILNDDGTVRICADYKETINQTSLCDKGPVPNTEDLFATLNGGGEFSKVDL